MARYLVARCPSCNVDALDVRVGRKSTARTVSCPLCHHVFDYSCWIVRKDGPVVFHQVDLIDRATDTKTTETR